ncbi:MAG: hypothetical protein COV01_03345, partial [Candidatus Taylorbacteria bacterium CG10_big_fil_rev_8_21_14_0_10_41_48]
MTIGDSTTTNATSTSFFSSILHALSATIDSLSATLANITGLTVINSTTTNSTTTNAYIADLSVDDATITGITFTNATGTNATTTNLFSTNASTTNATSTNFFSVLGHFTTGVIDTLTSTLANITTLIAQSISVNGLTATNSTTTNATTTNAFNTNSTTTNAYITNLSADEAIVTNSTTTNATSTNLFSTNASTTNSTSTNLFAVNSNTTYSTTTLLHISGAGTSTVAGNFSVAGNLAFGTGVGSTLTINGAIASDLIPDVNLVRNIGSPSYYWNNGYFDNLNVNTISAASTTISGTASNTFTINSDNVTADTENMDLIFKRGIVTPNALLSWDATLDKFKFNQPVYIEDASQSNNITLETRGYTGQTTDIFRVSSSTGTSLFSIIPTGNVGVGTGAPSDKLTIYGNSQYLRLQNSSEPTIYYARMASVYNGTNAFQLYQYTNQILGANYDGTKVFLAPAAGNVGIGTTSPFTKLSVAGDAYIGGNLTATGTLSFSGLTASRLVATDASKNLVSTITAANLASSV